MGSGVALASSSSGVVGREEVVAGIRVGRDAMSARIYNLAKRPDEDRVRSMAEGVVKEFPDLPEDAVVTMKQSNDEPIYQHNAHAERVAEFGVPVDEVNGDAD